MIFKEVLCKLTSGINKDYKLVRIISFMGLIEFSRRILTWDDFKEIQASMRIERFDISDQRVLAFYQDYLKERAILGDS